MAAVPFVANDCVTNDSSAVGSYRAPTVARGGATAGRYCNATSSSCMRTAVTPPVGEDELPAITTAAGGAQPNGVPAPVAYPGGHMHVEPLAAGAWKGPRRLHGLQVSPSPADPYGHARHVLLSSASAAPTPHEQTAAPAVLVHLSSQPPLSAAQASTPACRTRCGATSSAGADASMARSRARGVQDDKSAPPAAGDAV